MNISKVLETNFRDEQWSVSNNDYDNLIWHSELKKPTKKQLETLWQEIEQNEIPAKQLKIDAYKKLGLTEEEINAIL
jgi:hypothetical protein